MTRLTPFLLFDGNCAEAMTFYHECLGGDLVLTKLSDTPMKAQYPEGLHGRIAYAQLTAGDIVFSATDWLHPTRHPNVGNTVAMYVEGGTFGDLKALFDKLSAGAEPELLDELKDLPFGSYGHFMDKFGVHWFFKGDPESGGKLPEKS